MAHILTDEELACLEDCGKYNQYHTMRRGFESGVCGFCEIDPSINTTLFENEHWIAWENAFRNNRPCEVMLVIPTKKHWRHLGEVSRNAWTSFYEVVQWIEQHYHLPGGMLFERFGDMRYNAGTVPHLHWNLWVPDRSKELRIPIFKDPSDREKNRERAAGFSARYEAGELPT